MAIKIEVKFMEKDKKTCLDSFALQTKFYELIIEEIVWRKSSLKRNSFHLLYELPYAKSIKSLLIINSNQFNIN